MKKTKAFVAAIILLASPLSMARADQLDDMIATLRGGGTIDSDKLGQNLLDELNSAPDAPFSALDEAVANLYVHDIKLSIVDPPSEGGWPYRFFLLQFTEVRQHLMDKLAARFAAAPNSILAYALICPTLYAGDESKVAFYESFLKDNDPFLYRIEQGNVPNWRNRVAHSLSETKPDAPPATKGDDAPQKKNDEKS